MIKISVVSYLNTLPFIYGLKQSKLINSFILEMHYPSICAQKLINNEVDIALVPVVIIPKLTKHHVISDYCIGSNGLVDTVCVYSDVEINNIKSITLDYQSLTSVALLKVLLRDYWKLSPKLIESHVGFENKIEHDRAALVIGDRAFPLNKKHKYIYDLSQIWKEMTGLPFVFAVWVSNKKISNTFISELNKSLEFGLENIDNALLLYGKQHPLCINQKDYLKNKISYKFDSEKAHAMNVFLKKI